VRNRGFTRRIIAAIMDWWYKEEDEDEVAEREAQALKAKA
jgi:hypothetical protein